MTWTSLESRHHWKERLKRYVFLAGWTRPARHHGASYRIERRWNRDPHSFFIRVVSLASNSNGILGRLQFGLPRKSAGLQKEWSPPQTHNSGQHAVLSILEAFLRNPQSILPPDKAV